MDDLRTLRTEVRDCIGETIPLRRRWVSAIMAGPVARLLARVAALEAERDAARRERLPHMCRDDHPEIRHAVSDDDERCPVCRERDRALAAEAEITRLKEGMEAMRAALKPFAKLSFSFDGFSFDPAEMVVLDRYCGTFQPNEHAHLQRAIDAARSVLTTIPPKEQP